MSPMSEAGGRHRAPEPDEDGVARHRAPEHPDADPRIARLADVDRVGRHAQP
jgi:hypothetical protein